MTARRVFVALLAMLAALDVLILAIRVYDTVTIGRLRFLAAEGPVLYSIWKVRNGYPLYEWPLQPPYTLTLYNFLFYHVYAAIFTALRVSNDAMLVVGRLVTVAFVIAGVAAQYAVGRLFVPRSFRVPLALLCVVTLLGNPLPAMWSIAIRPDVPGVAFSAAAIAIAIAALRANRPERLVFAGVAFLLAWTFKQTHIALFSAMCVYVLVWQRSIKAFVFLAAPFVVGAAAVVTIGGGVYRANVIDAPTINLLIPYLALFWYRSVALPHLLLWGMALYAVVALVRPGSVHGPLRSIADVPGRSRKVFGADLTYPALAAVVAFATGTVAMMKTGSSVHHLLELNVAASLLCAAVVGSLWETPKARRVCTAGALMLVPMIGYDLALLRNTPNPLWVALQLKSQGVVLHLTTPEENASRERIESLVAGLPKPLYIEDDVFSLPWHSTGDRYPAVVLDRTFYDRAMTLGLIGHGVDDLFTNHYFASAVMPNSSPCVVPALRAGYYLVTTIPREGDQSLHVVLRTP